MLRALRFFLKDPLIKYPLAVAGFFTLVQVAVLAYWIKPKAEPIFLHYTSYLGVDFIGAWYLVYLVPLASAVCVMLNAVGAFVLARHDRFVGYLLAVGAACATAILLLYAVLIVRLNL